MVTDKIMAIRTAKRITDFLNKKGIKAKSNFDFLPVGNILRYCWYVKKIKECGITECIHINLPECGSFIAITNDCMVMSGMNVMVQDAIYSIFCNYSEEEWNNELFYSIPMKKYCDNWCDNGMILLEPNVFTSWVSGLKFTNN